MTISLANMPLSESKSNEKMSNEVLPSDIVARPSEASTKPGVAAVVEQESVESRHPSRSTLDCTLAHGRTTLHALEKLELALKVRASHVRRRSSALMNNSDRSGASGRRTHGRVYVSHQYTPKITAADAMAALMQKPAAATSQPNTASSSVVTTPTPAVTKPSPAVWTVQVEGTLLVGHLDYASASKYDSSIDYDTAAAKSAADDSDAGEAGHPPVCFTHLFDRVQATFQTIFGPPSPTAPAPPPSKKSSRRSSSTASPKQKNYESAKAIAAAKAAAMQAQPVVSSSHVLVWNRTDGASEGSVTPSSDTDAFQFSYPEPSPPDSKYKIQNVMCQLELYRRHAYEPAQHPHDANTNTNTGNGVPSNGGCDKYRILDERLQKALFPHHGPETTDILTGLKRKRTDPVPPAASVTNNQVFIPGTLTSSDMSNAFFQYISTHNLVQEQNNDVVQADKLLTDLLGMEQFSFSQLQSLLISTKLVQRVTDLDDPIRVTYLMDPPGSAAGDDAAALDGSVAALQFDTDVTVPNAVRDRCHDLLRRIKLREANLLTSRARARTLLLAAGGEERAIRVALEASCAGTGTTNTQQVNRRSRDRSSAANSAAAKFSAIQKEASNNKGAEHPDRPSACAPVHLALAQGAPMHSAARRAGHYEARLALMLEALEDAVGSARHAERVADAFVALTASSSSQVD